MSKNLGETWLKVNDGIDEDVVVSQVVIVNNQLLAATGVLRSPGSGIFKFNDDTNNWQKYGNGLPARTTVNSIALFDEKLVASTATFGELKQGLYLSDDSGATWKAKSFENKMGADILLSRSGDILVSTEGTGVWRSGDLETWSLASEGIRTWDIFSIYQTKDRDILAASENGIWRFSSQSSKWLVPNIQLGASSFQLTSNNQILSTAENNLLLGDENGTNWERIPIGGQYIFDLYVDSDRWYALDIRQPVKYSDDQGKTWQVMSLPEEQPARSIIKTANGDLLASNTSGIFRSTDNAKTWVLEIEDMYVWNFAKTSKGQLFASVTGFGMKRSDDNGKSWQDINIGFGEQPIRSAWSIAITNDSIYIAAYNRGFFQSKNNGESWQSMSKGLKGPMALSLYLDKNGKLYGGTSAGIYFWQE